MFNSVALDIFIGLILIYLLYSLFVSIIAEIIATHLGLRDRVLRVAIEKMLNDGYYRKVHKRKYAFMGVFFSIFHNIETTLRMFFLRESEEFSNSFAGYFYEYPSIKYLAKLERNEKGVFGLTKPAYITPDNFADTIFSILKEKGDGRREMDRIEFALRFNTVNIQPKTLKNFRNLFDDSKKSKDLFKENLRKWFNETMDRSSGWYKRKIQLILFALGFIVAISFNVDTITIAKYLSKDRQARNQLAEMGVELAKDTVRYKEFDGKKDSISDKALDSSFALIRKDISEANSILGLGWDFNNLSKPEIKDLEKEKNQPDFDIIFGRQPLFALYKAKEKALRQNLNRDQLKLDSIDRSRLRFEIDSLKNGVAVKSKIKLLDSLGKTLLARSTDYTVGLKRVKDSLRIELDRLNLITRKDFVAVDSIKVKKASISIYGKRAYYWDEKIRYVFSYTYHHPMMFLGFLITALAISLGSPFWFDLLRKIVVLRGTGVKPEEKREEEKKPETKKVEADGKGIAADVVVEDKQKTADLVEEALKVYGPEIKKIPGVKAVFSVKDPIKKEKIIQINVLDSRTEKEVNSQFAKLKVGNTTISYKVVVSGAPVTHQAKAGTISNKSGKNGFGSLGMVLKSKKTQTKHILSCWHVMKADSNYSEGDPFSTIVDHNNNDLAERWAGGLYDCFDYGIARCLSQNPKVSNDMLRTNLNLKDKQIEFRIIETSNIEDQISVKYYDSLTQTKKEGIIYTDSEEVEIYYADKMRIVKDLIILTDLSSGKEKTLSSPGNSGSKICLRPLSMK